MMFADSKVTAKDRAVTPEAVGDYRFWTLIDVMGVSGAFWIDCRS